MAKKSILVVLAVVVSMITAVSAASAAPRGGSTLELAASSPVNFAAVALDSERNLCQNVEKSADRCITVRAPRFESAVDATRSEARAVVADQGGASGLGAAKEPDCGGFIRWNSCTVFSWGYEVWELTNGVPTKLLGWKKITFDNRVAWKIGRAHV
jgi:hypothetical protein